MLKKRDDLLRVAGQLLEQSSVNKLEVKEIEKKIESIGEVVYEGTTHDFDQLSALSLDLAKLMFPAGITVLGLSNFLSAGELGAPPILAVYFATALILLSLIFVGIALSIMRQKRNARIEYSSKLLARLKDAYRRAKKHDEVFSAEMNKLNASLGRDENS